MAALVLKLDMIQTLALGSVILFIGYGIRRRAGVLNRYNILAPMVGAFFIDFTNALIITANIKLVM